MARKKSVKSEPVVEEKKEPQEASYSELHEKPLEEVIAESLETPKEEEKEEENAVEQKAKELEEKEVKEPPKDEGIDFDPEKLAEKTAQRAADLVSQKLGEKLTPQEEKQEVKTFKDDLVEMRNTFEIKNGRAPEWDELMEMYHRSQEKNIDARVAQIIEERENKIKTEGETWLKEEEETKKRTNEASEAYKKRLNDSWDEEISELTRAGKLPPVINKDDKNDLGVKARSALWQTLGDVNQKRIDTWISEFETTNGRRPTQEEYNAAPPRLITSLGTVYALYYKPVKQQPAGADAPVSSGVKPVGNTQKGFSYDEIHNRELSEIMREG